MSLYTHLRQLLCADDIDLVRQALELIAGSVAEIGSADENKQLETLAQTLVVESNSSNPQKHWRGLLHFELNRIDELECEDSVFRLDALIEAGLRFEHAWCKARGLNRTVPTLLSPSELYGKRKSQFYTVVGQNKTCKKYPLALQTRVKLQRHYVNLYKSRDRTREVQHTLPYKVAADVYDTGLFWGANFQELYKLCLEASSGQGCQVLANAWKAWETSEHPVHFVSLASHIIALMRPRDYDEEVEVLFEPKLLEFLQYELPKSSWKFFKRVNSLCTGQVNFKMSTKHMNFDLLHLLCQMDFPLSGQHLVNLSDLAVMHSESLWEYLPRDFRWNIDAWETDICSIEKVCKALEIELLEDPMAWRPAWETELKFALNSFDTSHWTQALVKAVGENSPRHLRSKDLVQIFEYFKSGWSNEKISWGGARSEKLTPRQLALVEKWITESGCRKLKALSELYKNGDLQWKAPF